MIKVGLIRGRHQMPVDRYLIDTPEVDFAMAHVIAYCEAEELCKEIGLKAWESCVDLYITGLTRAVLGAIGGFLSRGVDVRVWEYNAQTGEYESVITYAASPECPVGGNDVCHISLADHLRYQAEKSGDWALYERYTAALERVAAKRVTTSR